MNKLAQSQLAVNGHLSTHACSAPLHSNPTVHGPTVPLRSSLTELTLLTLLYSAAAPHPQPQAHHAAAEPWRSWCNTARPEPSPGRPLPPAPGRGSRGTARGPLPRGTRARRRSTGAGSSRRASLLCWSASAWPSSSLCCRRGSRVSQSGRDHSSIQPKNAVVEPSLLLLQFND
jgi:hypothetical protein